MGAPAQKHDVFQAIADPTRRRLLRLLAGTEQPVTALTAQFEISRTAVSKHLKILAEAGLVTSRRDGRETRFRLAPEPLREVRDWLAFYELFWQNKLGALQRFVESPDGSSSE